MGWLLELCVGVHETVAVSAVGVGASDGDDGNHEFSHATAPRISSPPMVVVRIVGEVTAHKPRLRPHTA